MWYKVNIRIWKYIFIMSAVNTQSRSVLNNTQLVLESFRVNLCFIHQQFKEKKLFLAVFSIACTSDPLIDLQSNSIFIIHILKIPLYIYHSISRRKLMIRCTLLYTNLFYLFIIFTLYIFWSFLKLLTNFVCIWWYQISNQIIIIKFGVFQPCTVHFLLNRSIFRSLDQSPDVFLTA